MKYTIELKLSNDSLTMGVEAECKSKEELLSCISSFVASFDMNVDSFKDAEAAAHLNEQSQADCNMVKDEFGNVLF